MRTGWRNDLGTTFPSACGSWAEAMGCTRIMLEKNSCVRAKQIPEQNTLILNSDDDNLVNGVIATCANSLGGAKIMSPDDYA